MMQKIEDVTASPTIQALVKEYKQSIDEEKREENRDQESSLQLQRKTVHWQLAQEIKHNQFKFQTEAARSIGQVTTYADERWCLLSIVARDYPYHLLQELFGYSPNTVMAAKVHCVLFGRGGTQPTKFNYMPVR